MPILTIYKTKLTSIYGILLYSMFFFLSFISFLILSIFFCISSVLHSVCTLITIYTIKKMDAHKDNIIFQCD